MRDNGHPHFPSHAQRPDFINCSTFSRIKVAEWVSGNSVLTCERIADEIGISLSTLKLAEGE